jgi:tetratricopeptide (TPR) repeat protein
VLFDLRSSGRRRTIKVIYLTLAFLMGGGLILFGIGGGTSLNGGLFDAFSGNNGGGSVDDRFKKQEAALVAKVRANPQDAAAYAQLARARFQLAGSGDQYNPETNQYTNEGKAELRQAASAWQQHLKLAGDNPDPRVATSMVNAYIALGDINNAVAAQEIVAEDRNAAGQYSTLAILAYQAGQTRKGDLARDKAIELTPKDQRETVKGQLEQAKQEALGATGGTSGSGG